MKRTSALKRIGFKKRGYEWKRSPLPRGKYGRKGLRARPDRKLAKWSREVRERDGNQCQWPGLSIEILNSLPAGFSIDFALLNAPCDTGDTRIDAHHIAERSLRPDLKYSVENGLCLCRTHHDWLPLNRAAAVAMNLLSDATYEAARKEAA